jgi:hypothetical protein
MDTALLADRITLRVLMQNHPNWGPSTLADAVGRSVSWVKKWRTRLRTAAPDDPTVLFGQSHAPHTRPDRISQPVIDRMLEIRDDPPENLQRIPGPKAIQYYLARTPDLADERLPRSARTIWRVLTDAGRILIPGRGRRNRIERPAPMTEWELDFLDVVTVQADPDTDKQQHQVEACVVVDRGTSILLDCPLRADFTMVTAIAAASDLVRTHGLPNRVRIDRDPRFVGGNAKADVPSPFLQFWHCLGVAVDICPPRRPDLKPFVERMNRTLSDEGIRAFRPGTLADARAVFQHVQHHYNYERPNQAVTCNNIPPRVAHPDLPPRPAIPDVVDPNAWLERFAGVGITRRVQRDTSISVADERYYVTKELVGHQVLVTIAVATRELVIQHDQQEVKRLPLRGLAPDQPLSFDAWVTALMTAARDDRTASGRSRQLVLPM